MKISEYLNINKKIKKARMNAEISIDEMASKLNIDVSEYDDYENGNTEPSVDILKAICNETGVTLSQMLNDSNDLRKKEKNSDIFLQIEPKRNLDSVYLNDSVFFPCMELLDEIKHTELLRNKGIEPRNKLLMVGTPGNGKTTLAEALAGELNYPLYIVRYDTIMSDDIGKSAEQLGKVFEAVKGKQCALFFDEFDTIGKSRNDQHDNSEFKRLVSSLLVQIDHLPSDVLVMAATNLESALDNAAWRRFQIKVVLDRPQREDLTRWFEDYERKHDITFGVEAEKLAESVYGKSYSDAEELGQSIYRQMIIHPDIEPSEITNKQIRFHKHQKNIF